MFRVESVTEIKDIKDRNASAVILELRLRPSSLS